MSKIMEILDDFPDHYLFPSTFTISFVLLITFKRWFSAADSHLKAKKLNFQNLILDVTNDRFIILWIREMQNGYCWSLMGPPGPLRGPQRLGVRGSGKFFWYKKVSLIRFRIIWNVQISGSQNHVIFDQNSWFFSKSVKEPPGEKLQYLPIQVYR